MAYYDHFTVVELPSKYPGTEFAIYDNRTATFQTGFDGTVLRYMRESDAKSDIWVQRARAALAAQEG